MEPLRKQLAAIAIGVVLLGSGCVLTQNSILDKQPHGIPCKVATMWIPEVVETPDPTKNGAPVKGIAGRVYLFGEDLGVPITEEGTLIVSLYDGRSDKSAAALEEWRFDRETLKRLKRKDPFGWGYTVFLPWGTYQPDITKVRLRVRFEPIKGTPLYEESPEIALNRRITLPAPANKTTAIGS